MSPHRVMSDLHKVFASIDEGSVEDATDTLQELYDRCLEEIMVTHDTEGLIEELTPLGTNAQMN